MKAVGYRHSLPTSDAQSLGSSERIFCCTEGQCSPDRSYRLLSEVAELVDAGVIRTIVGEHFGAINAENLKRVRA